MRSSTMIRGNFREYLEELVRDGYTVRIRMRSGWTATITNKRSTPSTDAVD